jgi:uncharacterized protein
MLKYIVVVVVIVLVLWLMLGRRSTSPTKARRAERRAVVPEGMVTCAHCGVHLPGSEAMLVGTAAYCSEAHRAAGPADEMK